MTSSHRGRLFAGKEFSERILAPVTWLSENQKIYLSGSFGGLYVVSLIIHSSCCVFAGTPLELFKCRAQVNTTNMTSYTELIRELYGEQGIRSIYRGFWATFWRDVPIFGAFFFINDFLTKECVSDRDNAASKHFKVIMIAGLAGLCNWVPTYPVDLVKTIIQCHPGKETLKMRQVIADGYRRMGPKFFYSGSSPTFLMAGPLHILVLLSYEKLSDLIPDF